MEEHVTLCRYLSLRGQDLEVWQKRTIVVLHISLFHGSWKLGYNQIVTYGAPTMMSTDLQDRLLSDLCPSNHCHMTIITRASEMVYSVKIHLASSISFLEMTVHSKMSLWFQYKCLCYDDASESLCWSTRHSTHISIHFRRWTSCNGTMRRKKLYLISNLNEKKYKKILINYHLSPLLKKISLTKLSNSMMKNTLCYKSLINT